jgi:hypothetical protein
LIGTPVNVIVIQEQSDDDDRVMPWSGRGCMVDIVSDGAGSTIQPGVGLDYYNNNNSSSRLCYPYHWYYHCFYYYYSSLHV